jgi:hypothetical protein
VSIQETLQNEILESKRALEGPIDDSIYRRDHTKRIELIDWVLGNVNNQEIPICDKIESRLSEIIVAIKRTHSIFKADKLHSQLSILGWIFYQVCSNEIKRL